MARHFPTDEARRFKGAKLLTLFCRSPRCQITVWARVPMMGWLVIVAVLVIGSTANSEAIHLGCEGAMRTTNPGKERLDEKYLTGAWVFRAPTPAINSSAARTALSASSSLACG
jgi:hypothetical protein